MPAASRPTADRVDAGADADGVRGTGELGERLLDCSDRLAADEAALWKYAGDRVAKIEFQLQCLATQIAEVDHQYRSPCAYKYASDRANPSSRETVGRHPSRSLIAL